jgi:hypothetical protein
MNHVLNFNKWAKLNENVESATAYSPQQIVDKLKAAMKNGNVFGLGTDDTSVYKVVVGKINKSNYEAVRSLVQKLHKYPTIGAWLSTDMASYAPNSFEQLFDPQNDRIVSGLRRHLKQFNENEDISSSSYHGSGKDAGGSRQGPGAETVRKIMGQ